MYLSLFSLFVSLCWLSYYQCAAVLVEPVVAETAVLFTFHTGVCSVCNVVSPHSFVWLCTGHVTSRTTEEGKRIHLLHVFGQLAGNTLHPLLSWRIPEMQIEEMRREGGFRRCSVRKHRYAFWLFSAETIEKYNQIIKQLAGLVVQSPGLLSYPDPITAHGRFRQMSGHKFSSCFCVCACTCLFTHTASAFKCVCVAKWWLGGFQASLGMRGLSLHESTHLHLYVLSPGSLSRHLFRDWDVPPP